MSHTMNLWEKVIEKRLKLLIINLVLCLRGGHGSDLFTRMCDGAIYDGSTRLALNFCLFREGLW